MAHTDSPELTKAYNRRRRERALDEYGHECTCCGESRSEFLAFDHVDGGGAEHRRKIKSTIVNWLHKNKFPDIMQILCHNCNMAKAYYEICPHKLQA